MKRSELIFTFLQIPIDLAMVLLSFFLAYKIRTFFTFVPVIYVEPLPGYLQFVFLTLPIWFVVFIFNGLYSSKERYGRFVEFGKIVVAVSAAVAVVLAWIFLSKTTFFSRLIIIYVWFIAIILITAARFLMHFIQKFLYRWEIGAHRVIILGGNSSSKSLIEEIRRNRSLGYNLVRVVDEDAVDKLGSIFAKYKAEEIIVANTHLTQKKISDILEFSRAHHIGFKMTPDLFLVRSSHVGIETLANVPIMDFKRSPLDGWGRIIKRITDLFGSIVLIILTSPLMILTAILVKITSRGPIFYKQERVGFENKRFNLLKFRSMRVEYCTGDEYGGKKAAEILQKLAKKSEADGPVFKLKNDPRLTVVGKFIRQTSLDELPQFFNCLKGQMSLIGPRPPLASEVAQYTNWQKRRLGLKPGITGLWQVSGRSEVSFDEWVRLDAYYIENWSLWLDFQIFLKTILVVIKGRGAY